MVQMANCSHADTGVLPDAFKNISNFNAKAIWHGSCNIPCIAPDGRRGSKGDIQ
jgi:hypothetical protein